MPGTIDNRHSGDRANPGFGLNEWPITLIILDARTHTEFRLEAAVERSRFAAEAKGFIEVAFIAFPDTTRLPCS